MNILLEARSLSAKASGVRSYTVELTRSLAARSNHSYQLLVSSEEGKSVFPNIPSHIVPLGNPLLLSRWLHTKLPKKIMELQPDIVHFTKADVPKRKVKPTVVTIYDVIPLLLPQSQSFFRRMYWPQALHRAADLSDHILTISEQSKKDIVNAFQVDPKKITVTPLAINHEHFMPITDVEKRNTIKQRYSLPDQYILFVGTRDQRKNIPALIQAFTRIHNQIPQHLVIVGRPAHKNDTTIDAIAKSGVSEKIHIVENATYEDLPSIYSMADLFVWPSIYEGWGFPPQEAMACGVPVIVSNGGALPEVVGEAGKIIPFSMPDLKKRLFDDEFIDQLSKEIVNVITNKDMQEQMKTAGLERVKAFTWDQVAKSTELVYESVV